MTPTRLKQLAGALIVLLVLWAGARVIHNHSGGHVTTYHPPDVHPQDADSVLMIGAQDTVRLIKRSEGHWFVNGNPATNRDVEDLFAQLRDTTGGELVSESPSSLAALQVDSASGRRVRVMRAGKSLADVIVGKESSDYRGAYVRKADENDVYLVDNRLRNLVTRTPNAWRDHTIVRVTGDSVATIRVERGRRRYALARKDSSWTLGAGSADTAAVRRLLISWQSVRASDFATPAQVDSANFRRPDRKAVLEDAAGHPLAALLFDSTSSGFWVRADTGGTVYKLPAYTANALTPVDSSLKAKPAATTATRTIPLNKRPFVKKK